MMLLLLLAKLLLVRLATHIAVGYTQAMVLLLVLILVEAHKAPILQTSL
jgi:hypothetical protein